MVINIKNSMPKIFILCFLLSIFSCKKSGGLSDDNQKMYITFPDIIFGIDISKLTSRKVVRILRGKGIPFSGFNPYGDSVKTNDLLNAPICIKTKYFIGSGFDKNKISRVVYHFAPMDNSIEIEIEFYNNYYNSVLKILIDKFKEGNKEYYKNSSGQSSNIHFATVWRSRPQDISSIELISLDKYYSLFFEDNDNLNKREDAFYLLIRSRAREPMHIH